MGAATVPGSRPGEEAVRLPEPDWHRRRDAHRARVDGLLAGHLARGRSGEPHPVEDFLFTYYSHRPGRLRRWHPGSGVVLAGPSADAYLTTGADYVRADGGVTLDVRAVAGRRAGTLRFVTDLLTATASRPARFGCFGLHEWAMVHRAGQPRHAAVPLRLGAAGTDAVAESLPLRCTHFDAFRFFTDAARPRNALALRRDSQTAFEQPGCLHATMDLYKWAYKLDPLIPSELVVDCLVLAREARVLDMRASPYDLTGLGYPPVRVETPEGRAEYVAAQRDLAARGAALRERLLAVCRAADPGAANPRTGDPGAADLRAGT